MLIKRLMTGASLAVAISLTMVGTATAQAGGCTETQFTSKAYANYGKAETELLVNKNPQAALAALNALNAMQLNCYEKGASLRLGAAIKIENKDYRGAAQSLETAINQGYITGADKAKTYYQISQIFLSLDDSVAALKYSDLWIRNGGTPARDDKWRLAVINQKLDRNQEALKWAEQVFRTDGPNAKDEVYKFLIYLYEKTGNLAKKAQLLEQLLVRNPSDLQLWEAIRGDYFRANDQRKAFEVHKAMYLAGLVTKEADLMRVVNFYNSFDAPYPAAKTLEKELNAGRIQKDYEKLELLANLYQVAREYGKAIPVIEEAAKISTNGSMYERLGRSHCELQAWAKCEEAMVKALNKGGLKNSGLAWVLVGQSRYERDDRAGAREAFRKANNRGGRGWIDFMRAEDETAKAVVLFDIQNGIDEIDNERLRCEKLSVLGNDLPDGCADVEERLEAAKAELEAAKG